MMAGCDAFAEDGGRPNESKDGVGAYCGCLLLIKGAHTWEQTTSRVRVCSPSLARSHS